MQLKYLRLAGFKSFVDPTRISFPTNMVAVVGPNGCGKSNIIDAVRWVLGELSAKNLRGDSMSDVIFNGTELRKPSGQCSIELLFDNSMGRLGGEYAQYNEISIKRVMNRDGHSNYYINNTNCRRKDVQDIFLGTGLGPRSYAIIEQGMVSKIVSAKPEDLRIYIEEVAGISKYKERRKETESKIKRTKENLSRVKDIKDEITRLVRRLKGQAKAAEKYNSLVESEQDLKLKISILNSLRARDKRDSIHSKIQDLSNELKVKKLEGETIQIKIEQIKEEHHETLNAFDEAQKEYYSVGSDLARLEEKLQNLNKSEKISKDDLAKARLGYDEAIKKANDFEDLSPKEKALNLVDQLIIGLENHRLKQVAEKLRGLLVSILNIASAQTQNLAEEFTHRINSLTTQIEELQATKSDISKQLTFSADERSTAESKLTKIKHEQSEVDKQIKDLEHQKSITQLDERSLEEKINQHKLDLRTFEVQLDNASEILKENNIELNEINHSDYKDFDIPSVEEELTSIQTKISNLGPINLAAPDEIKSESKRADGLENQITDLNGALEKLQLAIKKIDSESRSKFEESFNKVNDKIRENFPRLFGGGKAELKLLDKDALTSGIIFMATPPGKKNSSISQLSGGEKALTALSLVFALFQLNPAPFCMLDEVDAPLDDLNTIRFVNMVEEMSEQVQFIFITHNKISMQKSDHLMGITMQEAGVSRVVSVDVDQALELAAS